MSAAIGGELAGSAASPRARRSVPWPVWLLLAGALAALAVAMAPDWYEITGPYFLVDGSMVAGWLRSMAPFVVAASVVIGAHRWVAGRTSLHLGAASLGVFALLTLASDAWFALFMTNPDEFAALDVQPWLTARGLAAAVTFLAGYLLLARGLWRSSDTHRVGATRAAVMGAVGVLGLASAAIGIWTLTLYNWDAPAPVVTWILIVQGVLTPLGFAAVAALAAAAVRALPARGWLPEALVAIGATLVCAGLGWGWASGAISPQWDLSFEAMELLSFVVTLVTVIGFLAMIGGFAAGAVPRHPGPERDAETT
jgi:hypothetical protein